MPDGNLLEYVGVCAGKWCWPSALSDPPWIGGLSWISCTFPWKTTYLKSSACSNHSDWMWLASCSWNIVKHNCPWPNCSQPWTSNKGLQCPWMKPVACAKNMVDSGPGGNHCFARIQSQWASMSRLSLPVTQAVALAVCLVALCPHFLGNKAGRCWELFIYEWWDPRPAWARMRILRKGKRILKWTVLQ